MQRHSIRLIRSRGALVSAFYRHCSSSICRKIGVIGGGQMADAMLGALKYKGIQRMEDIYVYDINEDRQAYFKDKFGTHAVFSVKEAMDDADIILLAVKPQNLSSVYASIEEPPKGLILSVVAGLTMEEIQANFRTSNIVRTMPNTPAMVMEGITVWIATTSTPSHMLDKVRILLESLGQQVEVHDESYLAMATAISGSGPAYVFLTMEAMVDAAVHIGFPRQIAVQLVTATLKGSVIYSEKSQMNLATLKQNVTSPGGTTASALYELEKGGYRTVVADAIWAAYRRALELGGKNPNVGPGRNKL